MSALTACTLSARTTDGKHKIRQLTYVLKKVATASYHGLWDYSLYGSLFKYRTIHKKLLYTHLHGREYESVVVSMLGYIKISVPLLPHNKLSHE